MIDGQVLVFDWQVLMFDWQVLMFVRNDPELRVTNLSKNIELDVLHYQIVVVSSPNNGLYEVGHTQSFANQIGLCFPKFVRVVLSLLISYP